MKIFLQRSFYPVAEIQMPVPLWPDGAPGTLGTSSNDIPTLTPYLPDATNATGVVMVKRGIATVRTVSIRVMSQPSDVF